MFTAPQPYLQQPVSGQTYVEIMDDAAFAEAFETAALTIESHEQGASEPMLEQQPDVAHNVRRGV